MEIPVLYDVSYAILATIYLMAMLGRMPENSKRHTLHILRLHSENVQDEGSLSSYEYNICETCGSDEAVKALGYSMEAVLNRGMITVSTRDITWMT